MVPADDASAKGGRLDALALCHFGPGSEASEGQVLVKFAAARGGKNAHLRFQRLLAACEAYAALRGAAQLVAGTNTGRAEAYELMQRVGFRTVAPDRLPLIGALDGAPALYGAIAYGSRGLLWAGMGAELLASLMDGEPLPLEAPLAAALDPQRFRRRAEARARR